MNKYKFIFEKSYADRCVSKKVQHEIIIESYLDNQSQKKELIQLAYSILFAKHPDFTNNIDGSNSEAWSNPQIKNILLLNT